LERLIVPGGGAYADSVASVQRLLGLSEETAHRQALLAMEMTAYLIQDTVKQVLDLDWPIASDWVSNPTIWTPRAWLFDERLPASWALSSDSLALIVASRLHADDVVVLKSLPEVPQDSTPVEWSRAGWVDGLFPGYAAAFGGRIRLLGEQDWGVR
jgi:aspartokinase-like uncharacterized kinase